MWVTSSLATVLKPTALALGNFDGVHQGHRQVIQPVLASPHFSESGDRAHATVVTFNPHPQEFFTGQPRQLLTPLAEKVAQLKHLGVAQLVLLPFDRELARLSPEQFVQEILSDRLQAVCVSIGADFRFGQKRAGTAQDLQAMATARGIKTTIASLKRLAGERISSSAIRQALHQGHLATANRLLGRPYSLMGQVVSGQQLGRTIGFPTANVQLPPEKFLPQNGVYAVEVQVCESEAFPDPTLLPGVMNLGYRPTVDGTRQVVEVHLLDWQGDLYDRTIVVHLRHFLRSEQKFGSLDALKAQIELDCETARSLLASPSPQTGK